MKEGQHTLIIRDQSHVRSGGLYCDCPCVEPT